MSNSLSRVGTATTYDSAIRNISQRQTALSSLQEQRTAGKRVVRASDDPTSAAIAERAQTRISRVATDQRALESQRSAITQADSTLGDVTEALQRFRELAISAGNGTYSATEYQTIALEMQGLREQVLGLANTKDSNGQPLFGSLGSQPAPFVGPSALPTDYTFQGLPGQMSSTAVSIPFALDGDSAFMLQTSRDGVYDAQISAVLPSHSLSTGSVSTTPSTTPNGDTYTISITGIDTTTSPGNTIVIYEVAGSPSATLSSHSAPSYPNGTTANIAVDGMTGLSMTLSGSPAVGDSITVTPSPSIFSVMDNAIRDIGSATSNAQAIQAVGQAIHNIDIGMSRISAARGQAGALINQADRISVNQENRSIQLESDRSSAEDLDMIQGISDFQNQQTGYQAALQTYAQLQKLSLFNYIS